jgi:putative PIG3 family NAD(P)H quinone oxidoreductase
VPATRRTDGRYRAFVQALVITSDAQLRVEERPDPVPGDGEVLVRVHGAGLNRADLVQLAGLYAAPPGSPPDIPGLEFAGEVVAHGPGVSAPAIGARVFGIAGGGGQAELLAVPAVQCAAVPDSLDLVSAGGVPEVFVTAHDAIVTQAQLQPGETLLVHAVGSGVGTAGLQLARTMGCTVVGTARTAEKLERCEALGLDHAVLASRTFDAAELAGAITAAAGPVDVVLELVGGGYVLTDLAVAGPRGRIVLVGMMAGTRVEMDLGAMMFRRLRIFGTTLRGRSVAEKAAATDAFTRDVVPLLASGAVAPVVARTFPLAEAREAYDLLAADAVFGTIVLDLT